MSAFGKSKGGGRRRVPRGTAPLVATVTTLEGSHSAELVDVSTSGARLRGRGLPDTGEELFVAIDDVIGFGEVAWAREDERGVAFDPPLGSAEEKQLQAKLKHAARLPADLRVAFDNWVLGCAR